MPLSFMAEQTNALLIMADEFARNAMSCAGHPCIKTPHLDQLAAQGTRFTRAYSNSPICVPARGVFATGQYVHQIRCWDSAQPYHGSPPGWGHQLINGGHDVIAIGKLHHRSTRDNNGFSQELKPMHVKDGVGWLPGLLRTPPQPFPAAKELAAQIGPGETGYTEYDRTIAALAGDWLQDAAPRTNKPWALFVSLVCPHYPLIAPPEFFESYASIPAPPPTVSTQPRHPAVRALIDFFNYDNYFDDEKRRLGRIAYYALVSFVDSLVGEILAALERTGAAANTLVLFTSDHGEMLGEHGCWTKQLMYEDSVAIPLLIKGPGIPSGAVNKTPCSLVDVHPTVLEVFDHANRRPCPGTSLLRLAQQDKPNRTVFSEHHDGGSITASFMLRRGDWKYIHHEGFPPQLFNMEDDPQELSDLAADPSTRVVCTEMDKALRTLIDPTEINQRAFADQARAIAAHGGEAAILNRSGYDFNYTPAP